MERDGPKPAGAIPRCAGVSKEAPAHVSSQREPCFCSMFWLQGLGSDQSAPSFTQHSSAGCSDSPGGVSMQEQLPALDTSTLLAAWGAQLPAKPWSHLWMVPALGLGAPQQNRGLTAPAQHQQLSKQRLAGLNPPRAGAAAPGHCTHLLLPILPWATPSDPPAVTMEHVKDSKDVTALPRYQSRLLGQGFALFVHCAGPSQCS